MAEYLPILSPGQSLTLKASATITGRQVVAVSGSGTVAPAGANSTAVVGVAAFDAVLNDNVTIFAGGVQAVTASGAITAGDLIVSAAAGQVSSLAAVTTPTAADVTNTRAVIGIALTTAVNGAVVRVQFAR